MSVPSDRNNVAAGTSNSSPQRLSTSSTLMISSSELNTADWGASRVRVYRTLKSRYFENTMAFVICAYFVVVIMETDEHAQSTRTGETMPIWYNVVSYLVLFLFSSELILRLYVFRKRFWHDRWNVFDFSIIAVDIVGTFVGMFIGKKLGVAALRVIRLSRLVRATKVLKAFPELRLMVAGLWGAMQSIFWGTLFLMVALLIWSVIAVQFIDPLNQELADRGDVYKDCDRCRRAYESVFQATLTFMQQIVAGDSWGQVTVPIIENYPATALYFIAVFLSVSLAILNLILGVVVNVATVASDKLRSEMEEERRAHSHGEILDFLRAMDVDGDRTLNKDELIEGFRTNTDFRSVLESMDICEDDLGIVYNHLDSDHDGSVTSKEFAQQLYRMNASNTQFMLAYIKHYIVEVKKMLTIEFAKVGNIVRKDLACVEEDLACVEKDLAKVPAAGGYSIADAQVSQVCSDRDAPQILTQLQSNLNQSLDYVAKVQKLAVAIPSPSREGTTCLSPITTIAHHVVASSGPFQDKNFDERGLATLEGDQMDIGHAETTDMRSQCDDRRVLLI